MDIYEYQLTRLDKLYMKLLLPCVENAEALMLNIQSLTIGNITEMHVNCRQGICASK
jgi:hypothetical protein